MEDPEGSKVAVMQLYVLRAVLKAFCVCFGLQRDATAAIARRQQWQTIPIEDCPKSLQAAMQEPCNEVSCAALAAASYEC
jgi:hypothetical protein